MYNDVSQLLRSFDCITLDEMDHVKLLDRTDTKFLFNYNLLPNLLNILPEYYKILDVNGIRQNKYETLYFDTDNFKLYHDHHNGRAGRYKIRFRKYVDSDLVYFEVKYKNNKGRTIKSRIKSENITDTIDERSMSLINNKTSLPAQVLESKLWVNYSRITLVNKITTERLTLDLGLEFRKGNETLSNHNLVIAEVKQERIAASPFINIMKANHVRRGSISKYCFGVIRLIPGIKKNNFKPVVLTLKKLCHETII